MASTHALLLRRWSDEPPTLQTRVDMNPTLLVSWFCTIFSAFIILVRAFGRWVRTERLFREDKVMLYSYFPLLARMALTHVILIWGTNNTVTTTLTAEEIRHRAIASRLVLVSRILYAAYIWIAKITILEFVQRLIGQTWTRFYERGVHIIYACLGLTFIAVVVSTLAECQPFDHYWQVVPDPGAKCRTGSAQLLTMAICDILTDILLIVFPIPLVLMSRMPLQKKISLCLLFLLSTILIATTAYRIPTTIERGFSQQYRSLLASVEILLATGVANAIAIGSFLRDKGVKKAKFRAASVDTGGSMLSRAPTSDRTVKVTLQHWGSDEDLVRDLGLALDPSLRHGASATQNPRLPGPAENADVPAVPPLPTSQTPRLSVDTRWQFRRRGQRRHRRHSDASSTSSTSTDLKLQELRSQLNAEDPVSPGATGLTTPGKMSFFDVGGLVDQPVSEQSSLRPTSQQHSAHHSPHEASRSRAFLSDVGGILTGRQRHDDEIRPATPPSGADRQPRSHLLSLPEEHPRRSLRSRSPFVRASRTSSTSGRVNGRSPQLLPRARLDHDEGPDGLDFADAGGLLR